MRRYIAPMALLISTPIFAHKVASSSPELMAIARGDTVDAAILKNYCDSHGIGNCSKEIGALKAKAILKCADKYQISGWASSLNLNGDQGSVSHYLKESSATQKVWHFNMLKDPDTGKVHSHDYSPAMREQARIIYENKLILMANSSALAVDGKTTVSGSGSLTGKQEMGWDLGAKLTEMLQGIISGDVKHEVGAVSDDKMSEIKLLSQQAYEDPSIVGLDPNILCYQDSEYCNGGLVLRNPLYKPDDKKEDEKNCPNSDSKSENPPTSSSGPSKKTSDTGDAPESSDGTIFSDNYQGIEEDGELWATPFNPLDPGSENLGGCVGNEEAKLLKEQGTQTIDPDKQEKDLKTVAQASCDELVLGVQFCAFFRAQLDVEKPEDYQKRADKEKEAMERFKKGMGCDASLLGEYFCKHAQDVLDSHKAQPTLQHGKVSDKQPSAKPTTAAGQGLGLTSGTLGNGGPTVDITKNPGPTKPLFPSKTDDGKPKPSTKPDSGKPKFPEKKP